MESLNKIFLLKQIKVKQRIMYTKANYFGLKHSSVLECSKELDNLLNKYQGI